MIDLLYGLDRSVFLFINQTLANPVGDRIWPLITDYDRLWPVRVVLLGVWIWLLLANGRRGRTAALLLIPLLFFTDQMSSHVLKEIFHRARPCHWINGAPVVPGVHLLVGCGSGMSFPSSHAVNNFGVATLLGFYYRRARTWIYIWAALVALSRVAVGVHYPSDITGGAILGVLMALLLVWVWRQLQARFFPSWAPETPGEAP